MRIFLFLVLGVIFSALTRAESTNYGYPFTNPYKATVFGTPREYQAELPAQVPVEKVVLSVLPPDRVPHALWYNAGLEYAVVRQNRKAPLLFAIAGTGSSANSPKMKILQNAFYRAGFHVITLPSPTHPNFVASASLSAVPGDLESDARDLYRAMQRIWVWLRDEGIDVSQVYLTGFSLGAAQAPFVAKIDDEEGVFKFTKVLMINPPVDLYASVVKLDGLLTSQLNAKNESLTEFFNRMTSNFVETYQTADQVEFNNDLFYAVYREHGLTDNELAALIGLSFRLAGANMIFTSDLITNFGYIKPSDCCLGITDSTTDYLKVALHTNFVDYFNNYFFPFYRQQQPKIDRPRLLDKLSLKSIEPYLKRSTKIAAVTNADDIILAPGDLDYLRRVFGSRLTVYPDGGHGGNIAYKVNVADLIGFFQH